ncbi:MAG TPA: leucine-rich repeat domain-containing protein [Ruminococcus sp.]|nr:leucine-rich repeat domain-containing protein [Ruminococcus sp.]
MNNKIRRSIAVTLTAAALCNPLSVTNVLPQLKVDNTIASAAQTDTPIKSGTWSRYDGTYHDPYENYSLDLKMNDKGIVIAGCYTNKANTRIVIPKHLYGKEVVAIGDYAFEGQTNISSIEFYGIDEPLYQKYSSRSGTYDAPVPFKGGSSISEIGEGAFEYCTNLSYLRVGDKELTVGDSAFYECTKLGTIDFNSSTKNGIEPVYGDIGDSAFFKTGLKHFGLGKTIQCKKIGNCAFNHCDNLMTVNVKATELGKYSFGSNPNLIDADIDSPIIGDYAFYKCSKLCNAMIYNTTEIGQHAFDSCIELKTLNIPKTVNYIGQFAFYNDSKFTSPALFVRDSGQKLTIGRFAYYNTAVEYAAFSGDIKLDDHAFKNCNLKLAVVEGNVKIGSRSIGYINDKLISGFKIYGNASSNSYASGYGIPYVKVDTSKSYNKIMNENKKYFMGAHKFSNTLGSCAGISIMQMLTINKKIDLSQILPAKYNGKDIKNLIDVPKDANTIPEFSTFAGYINDYQENQKQHLDYNYALTLTPETIEGYAKLTEYGITAPSILRINNHTHVVAIFGIEKLKTPVVKYDAVDKKNKTYNYRVIMSDSGYRFKYDANGNLLARGDDSLTWKSGWTEEQGWTPVENTYLYLSTSGENAGDCYAQRYNHPENVKSSSTITKLSDLNLLPGSTVKKN